MQLNTSELLEHGLCKEQDVPGWSMWDPDSQNKLMVQGVQVGQSKKPNCCSAQEVTRPAGHSANNQLF